MTRARTRRPGTRGEKSARTQPVELPDDLPDAAEAALDDMLTVARAPGDDDDELATRAMPKQPPPRKSKARLAPPPPRTPAPARTPPAVPRTPPPVLRTPPPAPQSAPPAHGFETLEQTTTRAISAPGEEPPSRRSTTRLVSNAASDERASRPSTSRLGAGVAVDDPPSQATRAVASARREEPPSQATRAVTSAPLEEDQFVEERVLSELPALRVAIYEESAHLGSLQSAIGAAGHVVATAAAGRDGVKRVVDAVRASSLDVVVVAIPGGEPVIDAALALEPRRPVVVACVDATGLAAVERANAAGADLVAVRPHDVAALAPVMFAAARLCHERRIALTARGAEQVLRARLDELADPEPRGLLAFELFQRQLEMEIKRAKRFEYALSVALFAVEIAPPPPPPGIRGILRARAGNALIHTIRDIDIATQLDHERFLVLLPYTDLKGAGGVARRVIAAVAAGDPVVAAGRSFPPRMVGAVAGAQLGQPVSFAKLMKEATRALEDARRDGADLAVQP